MFGNIQDWFTKVFGSRKKTQQRRDPELNFNQKSSGTTTKSYVQPDADVHKLIIKATRIKNIIL